MQHNNTNMNMNMNLNQLIAFNSGNVNNTTTSNNVNLVNQHNSNNGKTELEISVLAHALVMEQRNELINQTSTLVSSLHKILVHFNSAIMLPLQSMSNSLAKSNALSPLSLLQMVQTHMQHCVNLQEQMWREILVCKQSNETTIAQIKQRIVRLQQQQSLLLQQQQQQQLQSLVLISQNTTCNNNMNYNLFSQIHQTPLRQHSAFFRNTPSNVNMTTTTTTTNNLNQSQNASIQQQQHQLPQLSRSTSNNLNVLPEMPNMDLAGCDFDKLCNNLFASRNFGNIGNIGDQQLPSQIPERPKSSASHQEHSNNNGHSNTNSNTNSNQNQRDREDRNHRFTHNAFNRKTTEEEKVEGEVSCHRNCARSVSAEDDAERDQKGERVNPKERERERQRTRNDDNYVNEMEDEREANANKNNNNNSSSNTETNTTSSRKKRKRRGYNGPYSEAERQFMQQFTPKQTTQDMINLSLAMEDKFKVRRSPYGLAQKLCQMGLINSKLKAILQREYRALPDHNNNHSNDANKEEDEDEAARRGQATSDEADMNTPNKRRPFLSGELSFIHQLLDKHATEQPRKLYWRFCEHFTNWSYDDNKAYQKFYHKYWTLNNHKTKHINKNNSNNSTHHNSQSHSNSFEEPKSKRMKLN